MYKKILYLATLSLFFVTQIGVAGDYFFPAQKLMLSIHNQTNTPIQVTGYTLNNVKAEQPQPTQIPANPSQSNYAFDVIDTSAPSSVYLILNDNNSHKYFISLNSRFGSPGNGCSDNLTPTFTAYKFSGCFLGLSQENMSLQVTINSNN